MYSRQWPREPEPLYKYPLNCHSGQPSPTSNPASYECHWSIHEGRVIIASTLLLCLNTGTLGSFSVNSHEDKPNHTETTEFIIDDLS